jgi:hypothetical protein
MLFLYWNIGTIERTFRLSLSASGLIGSDLYITLVHTVENKIQLNERDMFRISRYIANIPYQILKAKTGVHKFFKKLGTAYKF